MKASEVGCRTGWDCKRKGAERTRCFRAFRSFWPFVVLDLTTHYFANGQRVATRVDGSLYYVHQDHPSTSSGHSLGSTVALSDAAGGAVGQGVNHEKNERRGAYEKLSRLSPFSPLRGSGAYYALLH